MSCRPALPAVTLPMRLSQHVPSVTRPNTAPKPGGLLPRHSNCCHGQGCHDGEVDWLRGVVSLTHEAFGRIIHEAQLKAPLVLEGLGQGVAQVVRRQGPLPAVLELREYAL